MLSRIKVTKLFNLYDYDIDLANVDGTYIKYITAPNGYGKTSILDFIEGLMKQKYDRLFDVPFQAFELFYSGMMNDNALYKLEVKRTQKDVENIASDIKTAIYIQLDIALRRLVDDREELYGQYKIVKDGNGHISSDGPTGNLEMIFGGLTCHYITDLRLLKKKTDLDTQSYEMQAIDLNQYAIELKSILESPEKKAEYQKRIDAFSRIIGNLEFANKRMEVNSRFGFRFVAKDELETKLSLEQLSSGEKNIIIQVFELLFIAQDGTLVMIDEPEISLHMMWQINYSKMLEEIVSLRKFQCIVATHSPHIFNGIWSRSVDLFTLTSGDIHASLS